jgi:hypothetical protein
MGRNTSREEGFDGLEHSLKREYIGVKKRSLRVINGYLDIDTHDDSEIINKYVKALIGSELMIAHNASVAGLDEKRIWPDLNLSDKRISVAYASAAPVDTYNNTGKDNVDKQKVISELLIGTQYLLSILFAAGNKIENVSLMPLGGGVFDNPLDRIVEAARFAARTANVICQQLHLTMPRVHILAYKDAQHEIRELRQWMPCDGKSSSVSVPTTSTQPGTTQGGFPAWTP